MQKKEIRIAVSSDRNFTPGVTAIRGGAHICTGLSGDKPGLLLYRDGRKAGTLRLTEEMRTGDIYTADLLTDHPEEYSYLLTDGKTAKTDPWGRFYPQKKRWGSERNYGRALPAVLLGKELDWSGDRAPGTPLSETVIYRLHVRGFTKHVSSGLGKEAGTFRGLIRKIPYLKDLGITAVELMPCYEFQEIVTAPVPVGGGFDPKTRTLGKMIRKPTGKRNYWGYSDENCYFAPKAAYTAGEDGRREFCEMVKAFHRDGIEVYMEFYFPEGTPQTLITETARFWVCEYHIDGVRLSGTAQPALLLNDPVLAGTKIFALTMDGAGIPEGTGTAERNASFFAGNENAGRKDGEKPKRRAAEYNDGYLYDMRRVLRGDENQMQRLMDRICANPDGYGTVNYMANTNGFTMADMVSYEEKHNEANGENGKDGPRDNVTWNCGEEGKSRRAAVNGIRKRQLDNAFLMLFLSQGIPLILAGDEFGNSQNGNNNAYCQDNATSWLNWTDLKKHAERHHFVRELIRFRREHPVFHREEKPSHCDLQGFGLPDISFHGVNAWYPETDGPHRQLGILYCGDYAKKPDGTVDDTFYVMFNMHWNAHKFGLPTLPDKKRWICVRDTGREESDAADTMMPLSDGYRTYVLKPRSIVILKAIDSGTAL